jgi:hypothetical protein
MPAVKRYPTAWEQLVQLAREARAEGLDFESFWERAVRPGKPPFIWRNVPSEEHRRGLKAIVWPNDTKTRDDDQQAVEDTRDSWHRAYVGHPPLRRERALPYLLSLFERAGVESPAGDAVLSVAA